MAINIIKRGLLIILFGFIIILIINYFVIPKTAYVEIDRIYHDFEFKKELEQKYQKVRDKRLAILDSLEVKLRILSKQIDEEKGKSQVNLEKFELERELYLKNKRKFEEDNAVMVKQSDEQIFKQLTQYVKDFGEKYHYDVIHGTSGTGNLMYADKSLDITQIVTKYINDRYKGKE